jgi:hypothetical protein
METWPPLKLVLAGPLSRFGSLPLQVEGEEFERSLTLIRMERDVERLEKLAPPGTPGRVESDRPTGPGTTGAMPPPPQAPAPSGGGSSGAGASGSGTSRAGSWRAETEDAPGAPVEGAGRSSGSGGAPAGAGDAEAFENRMKTVIGRPASSSRTTPPPAAPQEPEPATGGDARQEAQAKRPAPTERRPNETMWPW